MLMINSLDFKGRTDGVSYTLPNLHSKILSETVSGQLYQREFSFHLKRLNEEFFEKQSEGGGVQLQGIYLHGTGD